jgi:hypothetical protein
MIDREPSRATIDDRLRAALTGQARGRVLETEIDMSAEAITSRLMEWAEMSSLCLELGTLVDRGGRSG